MMKYNIKSKITVTMMWWRFIIIKTESYFFQQQEKIQLILLFSTEKEMDRLNTSKFKMKYTWIIYFAKIQQSLAHNKF